MTLGKKGGMGLFIVWVLIILAILWLVDMYVYDFVSLPWEAIKQQAEAAVANIDLTSP